MGDGMSYFDYKVVSAPRRSKKAKGVREPADLFALTLTEAINEHARGGWEYVRAETLPAKSPGGFFRRAAEENVTVLIFRRARENLSPRLEAVPSAIPADPAPLEVRPERPTPPPAPRPHAAFSNRPMADRIKAAGVTRREPVIAAAADTAPEAPSATPSPLRPAPRLGPVDGN
jgi:hypothetical protein